jgi:hypothetical protein
MDLFCCVGTWCVGKTKNFLTTLVDPVFAVLDAIFLLDLHVLRVRLSDVFRGCSLVKIVNVHV